MKVKKRMIIITLMMAFMLAGCNQGADNMPSDRIIQNSGSTIQENVNGGQTEIQGSENSERQKFQRTEAMKQVEV